MKHFLPVTVLVVVSTFLVAAGIDSLQLMPQNASLQGETVDWLFGLHFKLIAFLFSLVIVIMLYAVVVFRRRAGDEGEGVHFHGNSTLEVIWTVIPAIIVVFFGYIGTTTLISVTAAQPEEVAIEAVSRQWVWNFNYPDDGFSSEELYLPVGQPIRFDLKAMDVLHAFWVPEFRVKADAVPGRTNVLRITPNRIGEYKLVCAELCGTRHSYMMAPVKVVSREAYSAWVAQKVAEEAAKNTPEARGAALYISQGCKGCHSLDGSKVVGPTWKGLYGSPQAHTDGSTAIADEEYLYNSIVKPNLQVVAGYPANVMPQNDGELLTDDNINNIIAYIKTIK